jgi:hypothetical protein
MEIATGKSRVRPSAAIFMMLAAAVAWAAAALIFFYAVGCKTGITHSCPDYLTGPKWEADYVQAYYGGWAAHAFGGDAPYRVRVLNILLRVRGAVAEGLYFFSYPPPALMIFTLLARLSLPVSAVVFQTASMALFLGSQRFASRLRLPFIAAAALSPAVLTTLILGQNGLLTGALLTGAFLLAEGAPYAAGFAAGLMVIKPQLALLLPICFAASGNRRAFLMAGLTMLLFCFASGAEFGMKAWHGFAGEGMQQMLALMNGLEHQFVIAILISPFSLLKSLGASTHMSWILQAAASALAAAVCWKVWSYPTALPGTRMAFTAALGLLASAYGYIYDMPALAAGLVLLVAETGVWNLTWWEWAVIGTAWSWPALGQFPVDFAKLQLGPAVLVAVAAVAWNRLRLSPAPCLKEAI